MMQVTAWELEYHDNQANSHKFYRLYVLPDSYMAQWGRIGTTGQFKVTPSTTPDYDAKEQSYSKLSKGYDRHGPQLTLHIHEPWTLPATRTQQLLLHEVFELTEHKQSRTVQTVGAEDFLLREQARVEQEKLAQMQRQQVKQQADEDKLKATLLRIAGRAEVDSAELSPPPDNNSMEAKLAAAMARAKESR